MEGEHDAMDTNIDQCEEGDAAAASPLGSPSYSPPEFTGRTNDEDEEEGMSSEDHNDDDDDGDDEEEDEEAQAARRKAKGKGKLSEEEEDDETHDAANRKPHLSPLIEAKDPDTDIDDDMDMDTYWAIQASKIDAHAHAVRQETLRHGREPLFGDADAAMNDALSPLPSPSNKENPTTTPAAPTNSPERRAPGAFDPLKLTDILRELEQHQQQAEGGRGRGRGRGAGRGWGLAWQETSTRENVEREALGAGYYDSPPESPSEQKVQGESGWEVYDEAAWERAAQQERRKVTLKVPHATFSVKRDEPARDNGKLVRALRGYKAILPGTYLSYEKDEMMRVVHRDGDGKLFTLLPVKDSAVSGRAHTKDFEPVGPAAGNDASGEEGSRGRSEGKGG
ncbi:MAG: hypothetical protein ASARMPRED_002755 [Alectoria sarmentosa]|nr:MAG: hypothetical protein ASARMPRED_002755 [Alectoria sarmentosa]